MFLKRCPDPPRLTVFYIPSLPHPQLTRPLSSVQGFFVVTCTLCAFIGLVWLREQILHGGGPEWLDVDARQEDHHAHAPPNQNVRNQ